MLWLWLLDGATIFVEWVTSWFPAWSIPFPDGPNIVVPMPFGLGGTEMELWVFFSLAVSAVLMIGRLLQWVYEKIPFL